MMGSDTFIIVAFICSDSSTPDVLASATSFSKYGIKWLMLMHEESRTSPSCSLSPSFMTVVLPSDSNSIFTVSAFDMTTDCSLPKKSPDVICATEVLLAGVHGPSFLGFAMQFSFTGAATRRSEFPSRRTGFTALPRTLAYRALLSFSSAVFASHTKLGTSYPWAWSSAMHSTSCGIEALTLGNLITFAAAVLHNSPSAARLSGTLCSGLSLSGKSASTRAATEMSLFSTAMPYGSVKRLMIGRKAYVASIGASSVSVYTILCPLLIERIPAGKRKLAVAPMERNVQAATGEQNGTRARTSAALAPTWRNERPRLAILETTIVAPWVSFKL
mmetsp:Transcript_19219/g.30623  ORF Transcript_19219/g.30623 Transcript_19219/m.30623 type:complete len:331 (+) Transcript_19219:1895-2887(+)